MVRAEKRKRGVEKSRMSLKKNSTYCELQKGGGCEGRIEMDKRGLAEKRR